MTEHEELKKNAEMSRLKQRDKELNDYMDLLHTNIQRELKKTRDSLGILLGAWAAMIVSDFVGNGYIQLGFFFIYLCALAWMLYRDRKAVQAVSELKGALKILRILGLIDYDWDSLGSRRKRKTLMDLVEVVKSWAVKKQKAQEEVYSPA